MAIENPARMIFPTAKNGAIVGVSDGQTHDVVQPNGIGNGEVLFLPPYSLLNPPANSSWVAIAAKLPGLSATSVLSLNAKDEAGSYIFTAGINALEVIACLLNTIGVARTTEDRIPPRTKIGWYDPNNPDASMALNLTMYQIGQAMGVARNEIILMTMKTGVTPVLGELVMCGWAAQADFGVVVPLTPTVLAENKAAAAGKITTSTDVESWIVEVLDVYDYATTYDKLWNSSTPTLLTPGVNSGDQITALDNPTSHLTILYKHFPLGEVVPLSQMLKLSVGKVVYIKNQQVGVDISKVL